MTAPTTQRPAPVLFGFGDDLVMRLVTATAVVLCLGATPTQAQLTTVTSNKCLAGKIKGVGKSVNARAGCWSKEASSGLDGSACLQKASGKFTGGSVSAKGVFIKLETKYPSTGTVACLTFADQGDFDTAMADYAASVPATTGSALGKCDAAKIKCVGKYVAGSLSCAARAAGKTGVIETSCTAKAAGKLADGVSGCLDKAVVQADCTDAGSQATTLRAEADQFIQDALCALDPANTACVIALPTPTATPTPLPTCTPRSSGTYTDNCDGTVTDSSTGLQWEKKTGTVGGYKNCFAVPCADPHDVTNAYQWCLDANHDYRCDFAGYPADGGAFTDFLAKLNTPPCFAGHCDWRLPSEDGRNSPYTGPKELESILFAPYPCGSTSCIDPIFGPTAAYGYSSSTTNADYPEGAWNVDFGNGLVGYGYKYDALYVRAVRGGIPTPVPTSTPCTPHSSGTYTDNCDGTVTDSKTGLQWEKKTSTVGNGLNYADPHDVNNYYTWSTGSPWNPDGTAFTDFLAKLNTPPCFAGHCDWRLPSEDGRTSPYTGPKELESILLAPYPCGTSPCIDSVFGPTIWSGYWSSTTEATSPDFAWYVNFGSGRESYSGKTGAFYVRAVRGGS